MKRARTFFSRACATVTKIEDTHSPKTSFDKFERVERKHKLEISGMEEQISL